MSQKVKFIIGAVSLALLITASVIIYNKYAKNAPAPPPPTTQEEAKRVKASDFTVLDMAGKEHKLSSFFGKPIVLNFWASWCPPCKSEMPDFNRIWLEKQNSVTFLMINQPDGGRETIETAKAFIASQPYSFPVYFDIDFNAAAAYGVSLYPTTVVIDKDGYIVTGRVGITTVAQLRDMIAAAE
ncbi:MAG: TlpA disulfide reductase family protein [Clostridia bacterium]